MIIRKIKINGFGKLEDASYEFTEGINLVYGENESGKSTLHKFIEGLFFGFFKPYSKNKIYTEEYKKYIPWKGGAYCGAITYEKDNRLYTASRNFYKENESVSLHDELTGEDITSKTEFDIVQKLHRINRDININNVLFKNTVSISQNNSATDDELAKEIGELLVNTAQTYSADVSYKKALGYLQNKKAEIGKPTQSKSKWGICVSKENELLREYEETRKIIDELNSEYYEINKLREELSALEFKRQQLEQSKVNAENAELVKRFEKYTKAREVAAQCEEILYAKVNITEEDYERYLSCTSFLEDAKLQLSRIKESVCDKSGELERAKAEKLSLAKTLNAGIDVIKEDSLLFKGLILKLKKVKEYNADERLNSVKQKMENNNRMKKICLIAGILLFVCAFALAGVSYFLKNELYLYGLGIAPIAVGLMGVVVYCAHKNSKIILQYDKFDTLMQKSVKYEIMYQAQIDALKEKYSVADTDELHSLFDRADRLSLEFAEVERRINKLEAYLQQADKRRKEIAEDAKHRAIIARSILKQTGAESEEEFRECLNKMRMKGEASARHNACIEAMKEALGYYSIEELEAAAKESSSKLSQKELTKEYNIEEIIDKIEATKEQCYNISNIIASLNGKVSATESGIRSLNIISEELARVVKEKKEYERMAEAYELAQSVIMNISKEIHGDFAGIFNGFISQIASKITNGKYTDIKTDDKMNVSVRDNETSKIVPISSLSGATIDQLYFALRLAIAELILSDKTIPIILDDCFIQYDEERLRSTLRYVEDVSKSRQVIIFTCRKDEKRAMDEMNINYKEVIL